MRRTTTLNGAALALPLMLLSSCFYPGDRGRALEVRVQKLADDNAQLKGQLEQSSQLLQNTVPKIDEKIAEVTAALEKLDTASRRSTADVGVQMQKAIEDVASLRGEVETYLHKITELEANLQKLQQETDQRFVRLQGEEAVKAADARTRVNELKRPADPKGFFALAKEQNAADVQVGRILFNEYLKKWPKDASVGEAHFLLGEGYRSEDKCREALFEYGQVIQQYGKTASAPDAHLASSECFEKLKMREEAKLVLEELIRSYPKAPEVKAAKTRLAELEKTSPKPAPKKGKGK